MMMCGWCLGLRLDDLGKPLAAAPSGGMASPIGLTVSAADSHAHTLSCQSVALSARLQPLSRVDYERGGPIVYEFHLHHCAEGTRLDIDSL